MTALLALSRSLVEAGHEVDVVGRCPGPGFYAGVRFVDRYSMITRMGEAPPDVLVCIPELLPLVLPVPARCRLVWSGNAFAGGDVLVSVPYEWAPELGRPGRVARVLPLADVGQVVDAFVAKSRWQVVDQHAATGISIERFHVLGNGIPMEHYRGPPVARVPLRVVYTSQPRRGLEHLLAIWPLVRDAVPRAELHVFGYEGASAAATVLPGVVHRGAVGKSALAGELRRAAVFAYPNTIRETFCTAVAEAQAAGLPVVTSDRAALVERVQHGVDGFLVPGDPGGPEGRAKFVEYIVSLLLDERLRSRMSQAAWQHARVEYDWAGIAASWETLASALVAGRELTLPGVGWGDLDLSGGARLSDRGRTAIVPAETLREWLTAALGEYGVRDH